jgi:hypothetical protein
MDSRPRRRLYGVPSPQEQEERAAIMATHAPRIDWQEFRGKFDWQQSEHVGLVGPNGQGKTTLLTAILPMRTYVTLFATKPRDRSLEELIRQGGYDLYHEWLDVDADKSPRRVLWPDASDIEADSLQQKVFREAFKAIYDEGNWCLAIDEGYYIASELKLAPQMRKFWTQSRSLDVSFVVGTQRPAWVPVELYDESTHLFIWRINETEALKRLSNLGAANKEAAKLIIEELEPHQTLYINKRTGAMYRTRAPLHNTVQPEHDEWERGESG